MSAPRLSRVAVAIVNRLAPSDWRESLVGDLEEEHRRRLATGRRAGPLWAIGAASVAALQLHREHRRHVHMTTSSRSVFSGLGFDAVQAFRSLRRRPGFALVTVLTLTLGTGANTAVFSAANWLLFRPVPGVHDAKTLVTIRQELTSGGHLTMSVPLVKTLATLPGLSALAGHNETPLHVATTGQTPERVTGEIVTSNYFAVLGQRLTMGRAFTEAEDDPGRANAAVISDRFWRTALGGASSALGRELVINGHTFTVVGVAARGFRGPSRSGRTDVWVPLASSRSTMPSYPPDIMTSRVGVFFDLIGRRAPGQSVDQLNQQAVALRERLKVEQPADARRLQRVTFTVRSGLAAPVWQRDGLRQMFTLLVAVAALLLLLTCANVANLLFARAHERSAELATRQALGAGRWRTVRQLFLEGMFLAALGGVLSLGAAALVGALLNGLVVAQNLPALSAIELDWRVFAFAAALSVVTCISASLLPALFSSRVDVIAALKAAGRGQAPAGRRMRRMLTTVQVAVAVTLVSVGLLLVRSMLARYNVPLGYDASRVLAFSVEPGLQGYNSERKSVFYRSLLSRLREQPGVAEAGLAYIEPFRMIGSDMELRPAGGQTSANVSGDSNMVSPGFFGALGATFVGGRDFTGAETFRTVERGGVVIVNTAMARALFGSTDVVGREVDMSYPEGRRTIVGVVSDLRTRQINDTPVGPVGYEPFGQTFMSGWATVHVRLSAPASAVLPKVRDIMHGLDPQLPVYDIEMLSDSVNRHLAEQRLLSRTVAGFAVLATIVAALGLYGVLARGVEERRREFGIRTALGARPFAVAQLITREALTVTIIGAVVGIGATASVSKYLQARLFGVTPLDPASLSIALALVVLMALIAAVGPARRASRVDVVSELK